ncbi:unnamed protein product [Brassica napus]|uniref:(rape) hypothetical protein n=1 Tax=Brassica napus TaxID=3708 RepID=A0A816LNE6_BRANA|nr:unnamed protein product [Brassica napus]
MKEFFTETEIGAPPVLSYWPPNTKELVIGVTTSPVIMTNDGALAYFFLHLEAHRTMNMFVTFETRLVTHQCSQVPENPLPFTTPNQPIKSNLNPWLVDEDEDTPSESSQPPDTDGVPPAAYDHDFWDLLLDEHLGVSDVAEVMAGIKVPKTAPHIIHCTTGNAFDHTVLLSGEETTDWKKDLNFHGVHQKDRPHGQSSSKSTSTPHSDASTRTPYSILVLQPPKTRRPSGRPKENRIPSTGEIQVPKKTKINRCGRCGVSGHNRTNCTAPI